MQATLLWRKDCVSCTVTKQFQSQQQLLFHRLSTEYIISYMVNKQESELQWSVLACNQTNPVFWPISVQTWGSCSEEWRRHIRHIKHIKRFKTGSLSEEEFRLHATSNWMVNANAEVSPLFLWLMHQLNPQQWWGELTPALCYCRVTEELVSLSEGDGSQNIIILPFAVPNHAGGAQRLNGKCLMHAIHSRMLFNLVML